MKLRKLIQRTAAAAVVSAMALSLCMPALASAWELSEYEFLNVSKDTFSQNGENNINYQPRVTEGVAASDNRNDSDTVFKGKAEEGTVVTLYDDVSVTFENAVIENMANYVPLVVGWTGGNTANTHPTLHLKGTNSIRSGADSINVYGSLTIDGDGILTISGTETNDAIDHPDSVTVAGKAGLIIKEYTHTADTSPVHVSGDDAWVKYVDAATGTTYKVLGNAANVPADNVVVYGITITANGKTYKVTSDNRGNILGDGKLSYDPVKNVLIGKGTLPGMTITAMNAADVDLSNADDSVVVNGPLTIDGARNVTIVGENSETTTAWGAVINGNTTINCTGDVLVENKGSGDVIGNYSILFVVKNAHHVTVRGKCNSSTYTIYGAATINCSGNVEITSENSVAVIGKLTVERAQNVTVSGYRSGGSVKYASIKCSGRVTIENKNTPNGKAVSGAFTYTPSSGNSYEVKTGIDAASAVPADPSTGETGAAYTKDSIDVPYICITPDGWTDVMIPDTSGTPAAITGDSGAGGAVAAVMVGGAAVWGGYQVATRVILHKLLPEGAAIPANRGQLALLVWNAAGRPEPAAAPAFTDVADADTAKAAQWCAEQGYLDAKTESTFKPDGLVTKVKVIKVWNAAFPKN